MKYALIDSNEVKMVILADSNFISEHGTSIKTINQWPSGRWVQCDRALVGYFESNGIFYSPYPSTVFGEIGKSASIGFSVYSSNPLIYSWKKNGIEIGGETNPTLTIGSASETDSGAYSCTISDNLNSIQLSVVLTVQPPAP